MKAMSEHTPKEVLIAISDTPLQYQYATRLVAEGFRVATVSDALACLDALRCRSFDIVIVEKLLPWGHGVGVVDVMKEDPEIETIPAVILELPSAHSSNNPLPDSVVVDELVQVIRNRLRT